MAPQAVLGFLHVWRLPTEKRCPATLRRVPPARTVGPMKKTTTIIPDNAFITVPGIRSLVERYRSLTSEERMDLLTDPEHVVVLPVVVKTQRKRSRRALVS